jgi:lactate permease
MLLDNIPVRSGHLDAYRQWLLDNMPNDDRVVLVAFGLSFGSPLAVISGFGTPVAITPRC